MKYTKEQKVEYYKNLRSEWAKSKELADQDIDANAKYQAVAENAPDGKLSYYSFYFTLLDMKALKLEGLPYVDTKTFQGWKNAGFIVKKGETSKLRGLTWIISTKKDEKGNEEETGFVYPKEYRLFHKSQVQPIE